MIGKLFKSIFGKGEDDASERPVSARPASAGSRAAETAQRQWISNPWHAVGIIPCLEACGAAQAVRNVRFLSQEAPTLPLGGCTARKCTCRYRHFQDRRGSPRRDADIIGPRMGFAGRERRLAHGRRSTDGV